MCENKNAKRMSLFKIKLRLKNNINLLYYIREDVQTNKFR